MKDINLVQFLEYVESQNTYKNMDDIRNVTISAIYKQIENLHISTILSQQLTDINFLKKNISNEIEQDYVADIKYNFEGFMKDAFFIRFFMIVENHINQIVEFYEKSNEKTKYDTAISKTFEKLTNPESKNFFINLSESEKTLFEFYCYVRNTIHKIGFQSKDNKSLVIYDKNSIIQKSEIKIELIKGASNNLSMKSILLIKEQIFNLLIKINSKLPKEDFIEHILVQNGYNK